MSHSDDTFKEQTVKRFSGSASFADWKLTEAAFNKLLFSLSPDRDEAAQRYELLRRKLIRFCESHRRVPAEDGADEIINRVTRKIDEGTLIPNVFAYSFGVAKLVLKEFWKEHDRTLSLVREFPYAATVSMTTIEDAGAARLHCFDSCLEQLSREHRKLIMDYYREDRHAKIELRKKLAIELRIPLNALRIRAHRLRRSLEQCVKECLNTGKAKQVD